MIKSRKLYRSLAHLLSKNGLRVTTLPKIRALLSHMGPRNKTEAIELIEGLLQYNPKNRLTCEDALKHRYFTEHLDENRMFSQLGNKSYIISSLIINILSVAL